MFLCRYVVCNDASWHGMHEAEAEWKSGRSLCLDFLPRFYGVSLPRQLEIGIFKKIFRISIGSIPPAVGEARVGVVVFVHTYAPTCTRSHYLCVPS